MSSDRVSIACQGSGVDVPEELSWWPLVGGSTSAGPFLIPCRDTVVVLESGNM